MPFVQNLPIIDVDNINAKDFFTSKIECPYLIRLVDYSKKELDSDQVSIDENNFLVFKPSGTKFYEIWVEAYIENTRISTMKQIFIKQDSVDIPQYIGCQLERIKVDNDINLAFISFKKGANNYPVQYESIKPLDEIFKSSNATCLVKYEVRAVGEDNQPINNNEQISNIFTVKN